jgi:hypothetical protein
MAALRIIDLVSVFYQRSFTVDAAVRALGPVSPRTNKRTLDLVPQDPELQSVWLELVRGRSPEPSPFLAGLSVTPRSPSQEWFDQMKRRFGRPERIPPTYPAGEFMARFEVRGFDYDGYVFLSLKDDTSIVSQAILRRLPSSGKSA